MSKSKSSEVGWIFPSNNNGKVDGFNDASIDTFIGTRTYSVVRETIQNSLDVRVDKTRPVQVHFRLDKLDLDEIEAVLGLRKFLFGAKKAASKDQKASEFYDRALRLIDREKIVSMLSIHDANATGLTGSTELDLNTGEVSPWFALVKGSGVSVKFGANAGGSYGHGSKATLGVSQLRSVFYLTTFEENGELATRFQGKSILQSMQDGSSQTQGTGFYGIEQGVAPIIGNEIPSWSTKLRREAAIAGTGTSIFIPFPDLHASRDLWIEIEIAVMANFYYAIEQEQLSITLGDGEVIDSTNLEERFEILWAKLQLDADNSDVGIQNLAGSRTILDSRRTGTFGEFDSAEFGRVVWFLKIGDDVDSQKVGICRNGMLITRAAPLLERFPGLKKFDLFLAVEGEEGRTLLRKLENPAHNEFNFDRINDQDEARIAKSRFKRFTGEVRAFLKEHASLEIADEVAISDLDDIFGDIGGTPDGSVVGESPGSSDEVVVKRPKKKKLDEGPITEEPDEEGMSEVGGRRGGEGKVSENPTEGDDAHGNTESEANRHLRSFGGRQVKDLRVVPDSDEEGAIRVYFTPVIPGEFQFFLFRSGDSIREKLMFRTSTDGELKDSLPLKVGKKMERVAKLIYVDPSELHNAFEGVMK